MGGYDKRGNMVLPVTNENGMNNVTLPEVTVTPRNINLAGAVDRGRREAAPYVSTLLTGAIFGPLSVTGGYAGNEAVNKITNVASNDKYKDWADMLSKQVHHKTDPTKVVKVSKVPEEGYRTVDELRKAIKMSRAGDEVPSAVPTELQGYLQGEKGMYPVFTQTKVGPIEKENVLDELAKIFESKG